MLFACLSPGKAYCLVCIFCSDVVVYAPKTVWETVFGCVFVVVVGFAGIYC